jgi:hypothetical protein
VSDEGEPSTDDENDDGVIRSENVKHLEMLQGIISRLAANSFLIKAWSITAAAAFYGIAVNRGDWRISVVGAVLVIAFWVLDSYYLRQERLFRLLYDSVRSDIRAVSRFSMNPTQFHSRVHRTAVFFSVTLLVLYGSIVAVGFLISLTTSGVPSPVNH